VIGPEAELSRAWAVQKKRVPHGSAQEGKVAARQLPLGLEAAEDEHAPRAGDYYAGRIAFYGDGCGMFAETLGAKRVRNAGWARAVLRCERSHEI
jgi:hypothetical protein